jgi:hypothetical protein
MSGDVRALDFTASDVAVYVVNRVNGHVGSISSVQSRVSVLPVDRQPECVVMTLRYCV